MSGTLLTLNLNVPFPTQRQAQIAYDVLRVDAEPKRGGVQKSLQVQDGNLLVSFSSSEARHMRVGVNSFLEHLMLVTETLEVFGPPMSDTYDHH